MLRTVKTPLTKRALLALALAGASGTSLAAGFTLVDIASCASFTMDGNNVISCVPAANQTIPTVAPACTINPATPSAAAGSSVTLVASCQNSPASWAWATGGQTVGTAASYATPTALVAGSYTYNLTATNAVGSGQAQATVVISAAAPPAGGSGCQTSASQNEPWSWQASDSTVTGSINKRIHLAQNQSMAIQFTTGASGQGRFSTVETADVVAAERYATISSCPGDFSVTTPGCVRDGSALTANINFIVGGTKYGYCALTPNTTYYFNIRHANPGAAAGTLVESCPTGSGCAFYQSMSHN